MTAKNDITGDLIQSGVNSQKFRDNFDAIFRKPENKKSEKGWDEKRMDIIGQNGNDGDHYPNA